MSLDIKSIQKTAAESAKRALAAAQETAQKEALLDAMAAEVSKNPHLTIGDMFCHLRKSSTFRKFLDGITVLEFCRSILSRCAAGPANLAKPSSPVPMRQFGSSDSAASPSNLQQELAEMLRAHGSPALVKEVCTLAASNPKFNGLATDAATISRLLEKACDNHLVMKTGASNRPFYSATRKISKK